MREVTRALHPSDLSGGLATLSTTILLWRKRQERRGHKVQIQARRRHAPPACVCSTDSMPKITLRPRRACGPRHGFAQVGVLRPGSTPFFVGVGPFEDLWPRGRPRGTVFFRVAVVYSTPLWASGAWAKGDLAGKTCHDLPYMSCIRGYLIELSRCGHLKWTCVFVPPPLPDSGASFGRYTQLPPHAAYGHLGGLCLCVTVAMPGGAKVVTYRGIEVSRQRYKKASGSYSDHVWIINQLMKGWRNVLSSMGENELL
ncbi:hypothetical protein EDB89DRAFT_1364692 [Lactarius sanguifluus]|nr:hypothetical protein EDB89DRAFT_1364692 [Lactarius sanguifluus]